MILTEKQKDSLTELINISFSRSAASLSELTGNRVLMEVPELSMHPIGELSQALGKFLSEEIATVHQIFGGELSGDAMLILDLKGAVTLSGLLTGSPRNDGRLFESDREVLAEVGNILLNSCLGTFGNMLSVHITFTVPRLNLNSLGYLINSLLIGKEELKYALVVCTKFSIKESEVTGVLVIVLGVSSLDQLLSALDKLG